MTKTILITGSSRGIGKSIAELAHQQGYTVIVHGQKDSEQLEAIHQQLKGSYKTFFDISDKDETEREISKILKEVGQIDVLINNAGRFYNRTSTIFESDDEAAMNEYKTNVLGTIHVTQSVLPSMIEHQNGSIVNIASIKGHYELSTMSSFTFGASKSAIISITKSLARQYSKDGIRINSVSPGYVETDQVKDWNKETFDRINNQTLLGRMAKPEEIAPLVLFVASDDAKYMIGEDILIDGGHLLSR